MRHTAASRLTVTILIALTWIAWSGLFSPLLLALGVLSCALVMVIAERTGYFDADVYSLHLGPGLPGLWVWLLGEIARANVVVAGIVLSPRLHLQPVIVRIDASGLSPVEQVVLANAITLTPGTLTLDVNDDCLEVHCLTRRAAEELLGGEMVSRVKRLSGD